jgi:hypothetical protein
LRTRKEPIFGSGSMHRASSDNPKVRVIMSIIISTGDLPLTLVLNHGEG